MGCNSVEEYKNKCFQISFTVLQHFNPARSCQNQYRWYQYRCDIGAIGLRVICSFSIVPLLVIYVFARWQGKSCSASVVLHSVIRYCGCTVGRTTFSVGSFRGCLTQFKTNCRWDAQNTKYKILTTIVCFVHLFIHLFMCAAQPFHRSNRVPV